MPFADGFWEIKSLNDTLAVVGFFLTLGSIWLSWYLARRDVRSRIESAKRETVAKLAAALLHPDVTETARLLEQAKEASRLKDWRKVLDRCEQAMRRVPRFRPLPGLTESDRGQLDGAVDTLRLVVRYLELVLDPGKKPADLSPEKHNQLDALILLVGGIEGRLRASALGGPNGQQ